jgi:signal transduction histidine kinase
VVAVGRDLSERRALEKHLYQTEKLAALGVMAGGIAHELRNPLSVSFSAAQFLLDPSAEPAFRQVCVQKILEGIERSSMIIENLLRFARPSSGNQTEALNLITLVSETVKILLPQAKLQKINLLEDYAQSSVPIVGNANLLQQVIMNLVLNAFQAMPDGGDVRLCVRLEKDDAYVSVQDAGVGILAANIGRIFDPFFTTRPAGQGTGLGLSICHTIVKQHLGSISVLSNAEAAGTTFVVRLPLSMVP